MKKRFVILLLLAVVAVGLVYWSRRPRSQPPPSTTNQSNAAVPSNSAITAPRSPAPSLPNTIQKPLETTYLAKIKALLLSENQSIEFFAHVIDQNGTPVPNARIELKLSRVDTQKVLANFPNMKMGEEQETVTNIVYSDGNGWVKFTGATGHYLVIWNVSCEGYSSNIPLGCETLIYEPGGKRNATTTIEGQDAFNPKKGYTLRLWRKGQTESLVKIGFSIHVTPYGADWYSCNLFKGYVSNPSNADFRFWFETIRDSKGNPARNFKFQAINGGLQLDTNAYSYEAPITGYEPEWDWTYEPFGRNAGEDSSKLMQKKFFIKSRNGRAYASVSWHWSGEETVSITGYLNPAGSRNLEPSPESLITDQAEIQRMDESSRP